MRSPTRQVARLSAVIACGFVLGAALGPGIAMAQAGSTAVRSGSSELVDGIYRVDARLQYVLSDEALDALDSGVPINIEIQMQVILDRRFWLDDVTAELSLNYQLLYNALSRRFVVRNMNTGEQDSYATLYSALNNLGRIDSLPVIDAALLESDKRYRIRLRTVVDVKDFPAALRLIAFWRDDWRLTSDWFEWQLAP